MRYIVWLFVFLIPWQARWILIPGKINGQYWEYGTQSLYVTEILLAGILVAVIVSSWSPAFLRGDRIHLSFFKWILSATRGVASRMTTPAATILLFLIYAGFSIFWAIDKNTALIHWRFLVEAGILMALAPRLIGTSRNTNAPIRMAIILSAALQAIIAIAQFLMQSIPASTVLGMASQSADVLGASVVETMNGRWLRAYGMFPHPNILGGWLVLGLIMIVALWREKKLQVTSYKLQDILLPASFVIILFGLLATFSRSAWLAFILFSIFYLLFSLRHREHFTYFLKLIVLTALTTTVFAALFPNPFFSRFSSNRLEVKSQIERVGSWREGLSIAKKYPLMGVGLGNYGLAVHRDIDNTKPAWYYQPVHNLPLLIWSELGVVGLLLVTCYLLLLFLRLKDKLQTLVFILPLLTLSSLDHYLWSLYPGMMIGAVWLASGCLFSHHPYPLLGDEGILDLTKIKSAV